MLAPYQTLANSLCIQREDFVIGPLGYVHWTAKWIVMPRNNAKEHFQRRQKEKAGQEHAKNQMSIAGEPWQFTIQGVKISCNFKGAIQNKHTEPKHEHTGNRRSDSMMEQQMMWNGKPQKTLWNQCNNNTQRQHWLSKPTSGFGGTEKKDGQKKRTNAPHLQNAHDAILK